MKSVLRSSGRAFMKKHFDIDKIGSNSVNGSPPSLVVALAKASLAERSLLNQTVKENNESSIQKCRRGWYF